MKSFLCILGAIVGLTFVIADDESAENSGRKQTKTSSPRAEHTYTPSLTERRAQRDAHRKEQLASILKHSSACKCGKH